MSYSKINKRHLNIDSFSNINLRRKVVVYINNKYNKPYRFTSRALQITKQQLTGTTCMTNPEQIEVMQLEGYICALATTHSIVIGVIHKLTIFADHTNTPTNWCGKIC